MNYDIRDIPVPYNDWKGLLEYAGDSNSDYEVWKLCSLCIGFKEVDGFLWDEEEPFMDSVNAADTPFLNFDECRRLATMRFLACLDSSSLTGIRVSEETGVHPSMISKFRRSVQEAPDLKRVKLPDGRSRLAVPEEIRPFALPIAVLGGVASAVCGTSVHNLMFGEEGRIVLPQLLLLLEPKISAMSPSEKNLLIHQGQEYRDEASEEFFRIKDTCPLCEGSPSYGQYRPSDQVVRERFLEMTYGIPDSDYHKYAFFSRCRGGVWIRYAINHLMQETKPKNGRMPDSPYLPSLPYLMLWSIMTWQNPRIRSKALDYFVCNDYIMVEGGASVEGTSRNRIPIFTLRDGQETEVRDLDTLRILSFCAALPEPYKKRYIAGIL